MGQPEFIALMSMLMALVALSIDMMLPAFGEIRAEFGLPTDSTQAARIVTTYLIGLAVGQVLYGPIADRFGRKVALNLGFVLFAIGATGTALAPSLNLIFVSRFVWGLGAAGPRAMTISIVRDTYEGERMARAMSFIMAVFLLVPIFAPSMGALILAVGEWRFVFWAALILVAVVAGWSIRLPETLDPTNRITLGLGGVGRAARTVITNRQAIGYTVAMTFLFGAFVSYLASSELIVDDVFDRAGIFPLFFGGLALVMAVAMLTNARIVGRVGPRRLVHFALIAELVFATILLGLALATDGIPPFGVFVVGLAAMLAMHALLIPNLNTVAMDPMGKVAGTASAIIGTISTAGGALMGSVIDRAFNGTITPLAVGFVVAGSLALATVLIVERGRLFRPLREPGPA